MFELYQLTRKIWNDAKRQKEQFWDEKHGAGDPSEQRCFSNVSKFWPPSFIGKFCNRCKKQFSHSCAFIHSIEVIIICSFMRNRTSDSSFCTYNFYEYKHPWDLSIITQNELCRPVTYLHELPMVLTPLVISYRSIWRSW